MIFTRVSCCRCPRLRCEFLRRRYFKVTTFFALTSGRSTFAWTEAPATNGVPIFAPPASATRQTSSKAIVLPAALSDLREGRTAAGRAPSVTRAVERGGETVLTVGSGRYRFTA